MLEIKEFGNSVIIDRNCKEKSPWFEHFILGKHRGWTGRRYRRGKNRCHYCGAPLTAPDNPNYFIDKLRAEYARLLQHTFSE